MLISSRGWLPPEQPQRQTLGIQGRHDTDDSETRDHIPRYRMIFRMHYPQLFKSSKTIQVIQSWNYLREKSWSVHRSVKTITLFGCLQTHLTACTTLGVTERQLTCFQGNNHIVHQIRIKLTLHYLRGRPYDNTKSKEIY